MSVLTAAVALPFLKPPAPIDIGVPIQVFGMIVAAGVLIGAALLRRYAEWHGVSDEHIRGVTGWITVAGFLGAHEFDVIMYQWDRISEPVNWMHISQWPLPLRFWDGISSYGGFVGGAVGFAIYVWWKRLPVRLFADIALVGLMPAFTIGRIGCTVVSDHIGAAVATTKWYAALAMNYPETAGMGPITNLIKAHPCDLSAPGCGPTTLLQGQGSTVIHNGVVTAWNLGLIEFLWLVPVNAVLLWLAFRTKKRPNSGLIAVLAGLLYSPVRFFLDSLRPEETDPRHLGLTFAQWASIAAFGVAAYVLAHIIKNGTPAEVVAPSSGEAQRRIKMVLKEQAEAEAKSKVDVPSKPSEAEDKAAAADSTEGDEGVDDPAPAKSDKPAAKPPQATGGNKNKRKK